LETRAVTAPIGFETERLILRRWRASDRGWGPWATEIKDTGEFRCAMGLRWGGSVQTTLGRQPRVAGLAADARRVYMSVFEPIWRCSTLRP